MNASDPNTLLHVDGVTVRFGGLAANDDIDLRVQQGLINALIGPNGAGKTTLFNVITGLLPPTSGRVRFADADITPVDPVGRARIGIARTFQNLSLVQTLSALDNVTVGLGRYRTAGLLPSLFGTPRARRQDDRIRAIAERALGFVGLGHTSHQRTGDLAYGDRRRVEIARALALGPRLLLLDEPSAGMGPAETAELAAVITRARDELGVTVLVVEHDMTMVRSIAEHTTVLDFGQVIADGLTRDVLANPRVVAAYLGTGVMADA